MYIGIGMNMHYKVTVGIVRKYVNDMLPLLFDMFRFVLDTCDNIHLFIVIVFIRCPQSSNNHIKTKIVTLMF